MSIENEKAWMEALQKNVEAMFQRKLNMIRTAAFAAYRDILVESPVDTGRFRSNWMISVGQPNLSTVEGSSRQKGQSLDGSETTKANAALAEWGSDLTKGTIYISNSLPYADKLENQNHSKQNSGFVARAKRNLATRLKAIDQITLDEVAR